MPEIQFEGETVECDKGDNLRQVLMSESLYPHEGLTEMINCGGNGTCGTCAIRLIEGDAGNNERPRRLSISKHRNDEDVMLACQFTVQDDIVIEQA